MDLFLIILSSTAVGAFCGYVLGRKDGFREGAQITREAVRITVQRINEAHEEPKRESED